MSGITKRYKQKSPNAYNTTQASYVDTSLHPTFSSAHVHTTEPSWHSFSLEL